MSNKTRKYFRSSINELKDICNTNKSDKSLLTEVYEELTYRKTRAAVELRNKLKAYLDDETPQSTSPSKATSNKTKSKSAPAKKKKF